MGELFTVSQSKLKTWRQCRQAYHYKYVENLRKKKIKRPFMFGRIVHEMHDAIANGDDPFEVLEAIDLKNQTLFRKEREMYGNIIADIRLIMEEYIDFYGEEDLIYCRRDGRSAEWPFELEFEDGLAIKGRIDAVTRARKMRWLTEHKTFTKHPSEEDRWRSVQSGIYTRAIEMLDWWKLDGTLWNYVKSKPPTTPQLLKSGEMSVKKLDTLPGRVLAFLESQGLDPEEPKYQEFLESSRANRTSYFIRNWNPMKKPVVDRIWSDMVETAREMRDLHGKTCVKTIAFHCRGCDFSPLCSVELTGGDVDFLKGREYTVEEEESLFDDADRNED